MKPPMHELVFRLLACQAAGEENAPPCLDHLFVSRSASHSDGTDANTAASMGMLPRGDLPLDAARVPAPRARRNPKRNNRFAIHPSDGSLRAVVRALFSRPAANRAAKSISRDS